MGSIEQEIGERPKDASYPDFYPVPSHHLHKRKNQPHFRSQTALEAYQELYKKSISKAEEFWAEQARDVISWERDFETVHQGTFQDGDNAWFVEGRLNASFNCVDRWAKTKPQATALIYEPDDPSDPSGRIITYAELLRQVCRAAWVLKSFGVRQGDTVAIYMPVVPEAIVTILACARIGAVHSVIFAGFSANAVRDRILDADARVVVTADEGVRGGKTVPLKRIADEAMEQCPNVQRCLVFRRTGNPDVPITSRDRWWHEEVPKWPSYLAPTSMSSEDPLFLLYTSGSTGKPKGLMHTTAGYILGAALSTRHIFDVHEDDTFFCAGDIGWITGHSYLLYGPLMLGCATVVFESTPSYPDLNRYWQVVARHRVTHFYAAPTALRLLKRGGDACVPPDMSAHLRVLGSVGEPIAANVWEWYHEVVGKGAAQVIDTYFQTESGSHLLSPLADVTLTKPGSVGIPFLGVEAVILQPACGTEITDPGIEGVLAIKQPIPSMARSVWGDHTRFMSTYYEAYPGYYLTGDNAVCDAHGYFWIRGRSDDVINVAAHRLSTAEIESALLEHPDFAEVAVVGVEDRLTGQAVAAFISVKTQGMDPGAATAAAISQVSKSIGKFAAPKHVVVVPDLPKTRSGKIMRRLLRKIWAGEAGSLGDTSTLINPTSVDGVVRAVGLHL